MNLAIIGDFDPAFRPHTATVEAIDHAAAMMGLPVVVDWIPTDMIEDSLESLISYYHGFWMAPGSPYRSMTGALAIIKEARTRHIPAFGTCGGFQHMVIEFARNVLQMTDADHAEYDPYASRLVVSSLSCSLAGQRLTIRLTDKQSMVFRIFGVDSIEEKYYCNFGLDPAYQEMIDQKGFKVVGSDDSNEARILELEGHPFFVATLFVPQDNSSFEKPHPLVCAFLNAVAAKAGEY